MFRRQSYSCANDRDSPTVFQLRTLTVGEYLDYFALENEGQNTVASAGLLASGITGWQEFGTLPFHPDNVWKIPSKFWPELIERILEISTVPNNLEEDLRLCVQWNSFMSDSRNSEIWNCEYCQEHGLQEQRNCDGDTDLTKLDTVMNKYSMGFHTKKNYVIRLGNFSYDRCPIMSLSNWVRYTVNVVMSCEAIHGFPSVGGLLDQSNFYFESRLVILSEKDKIEDTKRKEADVSHRQAQPRRKSHGR